MIILNLTQHKATKEQIEAGVIDLPDEYRERLQNLLTFVRLPNEDDFKQKADEIYKLVIRFAQDELSPVRDEVKGMIRNGVLDEEEFRKLGLFFMVGGASYFMRFLEDKLERIGEPVHAFTERVSEEVERDGEVVKINKFKFIGFIHPKSKYTKVYYKNLDEDMFFYDTSSFINSPAIIAFDSREYLIDWFELSMDTRSGFYGLTPAEWSRILKSEDRTEKAMEESIKLGYIQRR